MTKDLVTGDVAAIGASCAAAIKAFPGCDPRIVFKFRLARAVAMKERGIPITVEGIEAAFVRAKK